MLGQASINPFSDSHLFEVKSFTTKI